MQKGIVDKKYKKEWFHEYIEHYHLWDYLEEPYIKKLKVHIFNGHSIQNPLPNYLEDIKKYVREINQRIVSHGEWMIEKLNQKI